MVLCERHNRLRCGECSYIEQLEEENKELKSENKKLKKENDLLKADNGVFRAKWEAQGCLIQKMHGENNGKGKE